MALKYKVKNDFVIVKLNTFKSMNKILLKLLEKVAENHNQMEVMINEFNATNDGIMLTVEESEKLAKQLETSE